MTYWELYAKRTATGDWDHCCECGQVITKGQQFYDGNSYRRRKHVTCSPAPDTAAGDPIPCAPYPVTDATAPFTKVPKLLALLLLLALCTVARAQEGKYRVVLTTGTGASTYGECERFATAASNAISTKGGGGYVESCDMANSLTAIADSNDRCDHCITWGDEQDEIVKLTLALTLVCEVKNADGFCQRGHLSNGQTWEAGKEARQ